MDTVDYTDVPYLQEILNFLPINPDDEEDVINYVQNITNVVAVNYKYSQYQFAYFGIHLMYMTYIYCTAWKIGQIEPERYKDAIVFARPYSGREKDLKIEDADSIFTYSIIPEKDYSKLSNWINHRFQWLVIWWTQEMIWHMHLVNLKFLLRKVLM